MKRQRRSPSRFGRRGQNLVEFALILPVIAVILSGILEFGMVFNLDQALEAASRDGARTAASLGNYGTQGACPNTLSATTVDPNILTAVQISLTNAGVDLSGLTVTIYLSDANGNPSGTSKNVYSWVTGPPAHFSGNSTNWPSCGRHDGTFGGGIYDSIGISLDYTYHSATSILAMFTSGLPLHAQAVFPIGPPWKLQ